jgi:hypothetical protein
MNKKIIPFVVVGVLVVFGVLAFVLLSDNSLSNKISPVSIVTFSDENTSVTITKNNLDKTARVSMETYLDSDEMVNNELGWDMTEFTVNFGTRMICGLMSLAFFNESALEELANEWNGLEGNVSNEEGKVIGEPEENPLEGYDVTQFNYYLKDKSTREVLAECVAKGPGAENIVMKIDGKIVEFEEE